MTKNRTTYPRTLFERMAAAHEGSDPDRETLTMTGAEELKESVARDLESLLNARCAHTEAAFRGYPESWQSIASYGMNDFVGLSLANPADRQFICRSLERTIAVHERRLKQIEVSLEMDKLHVNRLRFSIRALLVVQPGTEPVGFDALLQPSTLQYSVTKTRPLQER